MNQNFEKFITGVWLILGIIFNFDHRSIWRWQYGEKQGIQGLASGAHCDAARVSPRPEQGAARVQARTYCVIGAGA